MTVTRVTLDPSGLLGDWRSWLTLGSSLNNRPFALPRSCVSFGRRPRSKLTLFYAATRVSSKPMSSLTIELSRNDCTSSIASYGDGSDTTYGEDIRLIRG